MAKAKVRTLYRPQTKQDLHDYDAMRARGAAIKASKPAADLAAGPMAKGNRDWGGRPRPFTPGMIPSWDKDRN